MFDHQHLFCHLQKKPYRMQYAYVNTPQFSKHFSNAKEDKSSLIFSNGFNQFKMLSSKCCNLDFGKRKKLHGEPYLKNTVLGPWHLFSFWPEKRVQESICAHYRGAKSKNCFFHKSDLSRQTSLNKRLITPQIILFINILLLWKEFWVHNIMIIEENKFRVLFFTECISLNLIK